MLHTKGLSARVEETNVIIHGLGSLNVDQGFYTQNGLGTLGLMPDSIRISKENPGLEARINYMLGTLQSGNAIISLPFNSYEMDFAFSIDYKKRELALRKYTGPAIDIYILHDRSGHEMHLKRAIAVTLKVQETTLIGFLGVRPCDYNMGYRTAMLAGVEADVRERTSVLYLSDPLIQEIPFFVNKGYRILNDGKGTILKVLRPNFDEKILLSPTEN